MPRYEVFITFKVSAEKTYFVEAESRESAISSVEALAIEEDVEGLDEVEIQEVACEFAEETDANPDEPPF